MITMKKILYPTDFSRCANQAFWHALYLSRQYNAELHLFHATVLHDDDPHNPASLFPDIQKIHKQLQDISIKKMDYILESYHADDINVKKIEQRGFATAPSILEYAKNNDIDLIILGTHGRRNLEHLILGSVAEEVVQFAHCPVLTIREQKHPKKIEELENILIPIDFSKNAEQTLTYALEIATRYQTKLKCLHVVEQTVHPSFYIMGANSIFDLMPDIKSKSVEAMKKLIRNSQKHNINVEYYVEEGNPAHEVVKFAETNKIDLIVLSTHGLTGLEHFLIGSVAEKIIRRAPCPVFTVKTYGKSLIKKEF